MTSPAGAATPISTIDALDLALFQYPGNQPRPQAFGPDGSSYSVVKEDEVLRIGPDGMNTLLPIGGFHDATQYGFIVYSIGYLWFSAFEGYIRMRPDGSDVTYHQQVFDRPIAAPDGVYSINGINGSYIEHIDVNFKQTLFPVGSSGSPYGGYLERLVYAPDGTVYFTYKTCCRKKDVLGLLPPGGYAHYFYDGNPCGTPGKLVFSRNFIYFIGNDSTAGTYTLCRVTAAGNFDAVSAAVPVSGRPYPITEAIAADRDGGIWTANLYGPGLYAYDSGTRQVAGPYEPALLSGLTQYLAIDPLENIRLFGAYAGNQLFAGTYVRHRQTFVPTVLGLSSLDIKMNFYVTEPVPSAPWTARSLNPAVATGSPTTSLVGRFTVTETGTGATTIVVTDKYGNVANEPVTATAGLASVPAARSR